MLLLRALMARPALARVAAAVVHAVNALIGDRYLAWRGASIRLSVSRRLWTGRYRMRYGPAAEREYEVWAPLPFLRAERWRRVPSHQLDHIP